MRERRHFAEHIMANLQGAFLYHLAGSTDDGRTLGNGRRARSARGQPDPLPSPTRSSSGPERLPRRSAEEIERTLHAFVLLVKTHEDGMRAEEIRSMLGMQAREMPRILKEGLAKKKLTSVKNAYHVHTEDIDQNGVRAGGHQWEGLVNICVRAAEEVLETALQPLAAIA